MKHHFLICFVVCTSLIRLQAFVPTMFDTKSFMRDQKLQRSLTFMGRPQHRHAILKLRAKSDGQGDEWRKFEEGIQQFQQGLQQIQSGLGLAAEGALNSLGRTALVNVEGLLGKEELIGRLEAAQSVVLKNIGIGEVYCIGQSLSSILFWRSKLLFYVHAVKAHLNVAMYNDDFSSFQDADDTPDPNGPPFRLQVYNPSLIPLPSQICLSSAFSPIR